MALLDSTLAVFLDDLRRADELLVLVKEFRKFGASSPPSSVESGESAWPEAISLAASAQGVRTDLPIFSGSILMYVTGRFEYFVREAVVLIADDMASKVTKYNDLPDEIRKNLRAKTLEVAQNPVKYGFDENDSAQFVTTLGKCLDATNTDPFVIHSRLLAVTETNMHSRALAEVLKRINIDKLWVEAGKQLKLKKYLGKTTDGECTQEAQARLDKMMKDRNGIAHPTGSTVFPDEAKVLEASEFLKELSQVIVDYVHLSR